MARFKTPEYVRVRVSHGKWVRGTTLSHLDGATQTFRVELGSPLWDKLDLQVCAEGIGWERAQHPDDEDAASPPEPKR